MINNVLLLTRISHGNVNSKPETYSIWDAYRDGLSYHIKNFHALDYYDLYFTYGKQQFEKKIEQKVKKNNIQFLFIGYMAEDYTFDLNFLLKLKNTYNLCIINTSQDPETFFETRDRYYNQIADYVLPFTVLPNGCIYKNYNIDTVTLYSLYNKDMFLDKQLEETIDVSFIGNCNKANRQEYIKYLKQNGINIQTYGVGSDNGFINHHEMMNIINSSKINLNFTESAFSTEFDFNTNTNFTIGTKINSRIQQAKGRIVEIYLTNSFCLSQEGQGTRALFDDERIIFQNKEDLLRKIKYYLDNENKRKVITKKLYQEALQYDATNRFKKLLPKILFKSKKINKLYIDEVFIKNYTSYHFLFMFNFLFKRKFKLVFEEIKVFFKYKKVDINTIRYHLKMQAIYAYKRYKSISK